MNISLIKRARCLNKEAIGGLRATALYATTMAYIESCHVAPTRLSSLERALEALCAHVQDTLTDDQFAAYQKRLREDEDVNA